MKTSKISPTELYRIAEIAAVSVTKSRDEDIIGEALIYAVKAWNAGQSPQTIMWAAKNGAVQHLRKTKGRQGQKAKSPVFSGSVLQLLPFSDAYEMFEEAGYQKIENKEWLESAFNYLPEKHARFARLYCMELSTSEIMQEMGITQPRASQIKSEIVTKLKNAVDKGLL